VISRALDDVAERFGLADSGQALVKLALLYLERRS
jgi:hypothetical protein